MMRLGDRIARAANNAKAGDRHAKRALLALAFERYYRTIEGDTCHYCCGPAECTDHAYPLSKVAEADDVLGLPPDLMVKVPSCFVCNALLGSKVFTSMDDRKRAARLQKRAGRKNGRVPVAHRMPFPEPRETKESHFDGPGTLTHPRGRRQPKRNLHVQIHHRSIELTGQRFGRLVAKRSVRGRRNKVAWICACDCGAETEVETSRLRSGNTRSCGCLRQRKPPHGRKV